MDTRDYQLNKVINYVAMDVTMAWLDQLQSQNESLAAVAKIASTDYLYNPTLSELDIGVAVVKFSQGKPQLPTSIGAADQFVSAQEYLQGLIQFIRQDAVAREELAKTLFEKTGVRLSFIVSDFDSTTSQDQEQKTLLLGRIAQLKKEIDYQGTQDDLKLRYALILSLAASPINFDATLSEQHTLPVWETLAGNPTACNGLENAYHSTFVYAFGDTVHWQSYELFQAADGEWRGHGFAGLQFDGQAEIIVDPALLITGYKFFTRSAIPSPLQAVAISELENQAVDIVTIMREDRISAVPKMTIAQKLKDLNLALLLAPDSIFVLLEACAVYAELANLTVEQRAQAGLPISTEEIDNLRVNFKTRAEEIYPGVLARYNVR